MDTQPLENSIRRLARMLAEYARIEEIEDHLQEAVKESLLQPFSLVPTCRVGMQKLRAAEY